MLVFGAAWVGAQEAPKAVDLGLSVQWGDVDIAPEVDIPEGWRMPTLAEIKDWQPLGKGIRHSGFGWLLSQSDYPEPPFKGPQSGWLLHLGGTGRDQPGPKKVPCTFSQRIAL